MCGTQGLRQGLAVAAITVIVGLAAPASAQTPSAQSPSAPPPDPNPGGLTLTGSFDAESTYMFRGIRQNSTGIALWPVADLGVAVYSGDGGLKSAGINIGTWNSLHTGDTGQDGPTGKLWYESDFYSKLTLGFGGGTSVGVLYTAYTSPNNAFTTVKEIAFQLAVDDSAHLGKAAAQAVRARGFRIRHRPGRRAGRRRSEGRPVSRARRWRPAMQAQKPRSPSR